MRFPNFYILLAIIYYILPLITIILLAIKAAGVLKPDRLFSVTYSLCIIVTSRIKQDLFQGNAEKKFFFDFLLLQTKKFISSELKR